MNNPNPFVPKGSLLEQQSQRRFRLKFAVGCVLAVSVTGLVAMLIQGCKREQPSNENLPPVVDTNIAPPAFDTNMLSSGAPSNTVSIPSPVPPTPVPPVPAVVPVAVDTGGSEYVVVQGDTLGKIAKAHGVTLKALEAANPGVDSKKLKLKQKLVIPASAKSVEAAPAALAATGAADAGGEVYVVKNNDTLTKIASKHGVKLKALKAANNLTTDHIKVGDKLKIPAKAETAAPAAPEPAAAPALPPASAPAPIAPTPAPGK